MDIKYLNAILKTKVIELAQSESFVHHKRYIQYHLSILENLCKELFAFYPEANQDQVMSLMRIHDYCKITNTPEEPDYSAVYNFLLDLGFEKNYADTIRNFLVIFESKMEFDLHQAPIEVQIVSSCDALAHYIGPFFDIYAWENPQKTLEELMKDRAGKFHKDWERKITLPEVQHILEQRKEFFLECFCGKIKESYF